MNPDHPAFKDSAFLAYYNEKMPPWFCRVHATQARKPVPTKEIASRASLSPAQVKVMARASTWLPFEMSTIVRFCWACGVDLQHLNRPRKKILRWMRSNRPPPHLSTPQRKYWNSLFTGEKEWRKTA